MGYHPAGYAKGITNSKTVTEEGEYVLDARQNNPSLPDTLAYEIKRIEAEFKEKLKWKFIGVFDLESNIEKSIDIPETAQEIWVVVGEKSGETQIYGGNSAVILKSYDNPVNNRHILFFNEIHGATGATLAEGAKVFYDKNSLKIEVKNIGNGFFIHARVYYR